MDGRPGDDGPPPYDKSGGGTNNRERRDDSMTLLVQTERILANFRILQKQAGGTPLIPTLEANA